MSTTETTDGAATARGLSGAEAADRRRRGESNTAPNASTRSYARILHTNVFSFFNIILFVIGVALLAMGRYSDALISVGLGLINALISASQEIRAKRKLDRLQLLDRTPVVAVRDGTEVAIAPEEVVRGDVLRVRAGDQIVVDGPLLPGGPVEADESLLTGESDPVVKNPGDDLRSGSLCVAGEGHLLARDVGAASYAGRLTADARRATTDTTPLQRRITFVVRLVMTLTVLMSAAILAQALLEGFTLVRIVQITAVLSGLVPYGLFFLIAVAYTAGAARIAGSGALVQQVNAVESVSNVDVVCTDKTGTLTTGRLRLTDVEPVGDTPGLDASAALGAVPAAIVTGSVATAVYAFLYESVTQFISSGRTPAQAISDFESYTGLTYTDADFAAAAATIGAQTGLSTFVCLASFILILFLAPPARLFAAWTPPVADRRPTALVAVLVAAFGAVLFVPALYRYFGLTAGNSFVFRIVGGAVVLWFAALSAAYHYRLLDRVLGLEQIREASGRQ